MAHIDKKNNQESKTPSQKTKNKSAKMKLETAREIGIFKESKE